jgi:hypothetical protein
VRALTDFLAALRGGVADEYRRARPRTKIAAVVVLAGCLALGGAYLATAGGDDTATPGGDLDVTEPGTGADDVERLPQSPAATPVDLASPTPGERLDPPAADAEAGDGEDAGQGDPVEGRSASGADASDTGASDVDGESGGPDAGTVATTTPTTDATGGPTTSTPGGPATTSPTTAPPADGGSVLGGVLDLLHVLV